MKVNCPYCQSEVEFDERSKIASGDTEFCTSCDSEFEITRISDDWITEELGTRLCFDCESFECNCDDDYCDRCFSSHEDCTCDDDRCEACGCLYCDCNDSVCIECGCDDCECYLL